MAKCEAHHICQCLGEKMKALETANRKIVRENDKLAKQLGDIPDMKAFAKAVGDSKKLLEPFTVEGFLDD